MLYVCVTPLRSNVVNASEPTLPHVQLIPLVCTRVVRSQPLPSSHFTHSISALMFLRDVLHSDSHSPFPRQKQPGLSLVRCVAPPSCCFPLCISLLSRDPQFYRVGCHPTIAIWMIAPPIETPPTTCKPLVATCSTRRDMPTAQLGVATQLRAQQIW